MSLSIRIFIAFVVFVSACCYFILQMVTAEVKPGVRQSTEETLVDTANLLAEFLREPLLNEQMQSESLRNILAAYGQRTPQATIWGIEKNLLDNRIYVTDDQGIVVFDSGNLAVGQDYSRWNDVYLTLRGQYGARSTLADPSDTRSSVMHVAAPIRHDGKIIGVVTVAKPNLSFQPYITRAQQRLVLFGAAVVVFGVMLGGFFSWWFSREMGQLRRYALNVSEGKRAELPINYLHSRELKQLAYALEAMRTELDGKAYVEKYMQIFAHELKSPLAGIRATTELLQMSNAQSMDETQRQRFIANIDQDSQRLQLMLERVLNLAQVEQMHQLKEVQPLELAPIVEDVVERNRTRALQKPVELAFTCTDSCTVAGDTFLLTQSVQNLLDNALDFASPDTVIQLKLGRDTTHAYIDVTNHGDSIPEYALPRVTERFYSLSRPTSGRKSTGIGLNFVKEVMQLHSGSLHVKNVENGVEVTLKFPLHNTHNG